MTALAEVDSTTNGIVKVRLHRVLHGSDVVHDGGEPSLKLDLATKPGDLLLLFGNPDADEQLVWHAVPVDETSYAYFIRAPRLTLTPEERLPYFAKYLEHRDPLIAEDAYLEFAHAPFELVNDSSALLPMAQIAHWLTNPNIPTHRKGFYGLALGLAREDDVRQANAELLRRLILAPEDDFRAGFDGVLGGYLLLRGAQGLELIENRYLSNGNAAVGDVRHAMTALRFYHEYGHDIPHERLAQAMQHLLRRPEFAEAAIVDLARWQAWGALNDVVALHGDQDFASPGTVRAIVGYLHACPLPAAHAALSRLREEDPAGIAAAEKILLQTGGISTSE